MKLSIMLLGLAEEEIKKKNYTFTELLNMIKKVGIDAVDLGILEIITVGKKEVVQALKESELKVGCCLNFIALFNRDDVVFEKAIDEGIRGVDLTIEMGAKVMMIVPQLVEWDMNGPIIDENMWSKKPVVEASKDQLTERLIKGLIPIVAYAKEKGITIGIEDDPRLNVPLCSMAQLKRIFDAIPDVGLIFDTANMLIVNEDPVEYFNVFKDRICHFHLKEVIRAEAGEKGDLTIDGIPIKNVKHGTGIINFKEIIKCAEDSGFNGYMALEYSGIGDHRKNLKDIVTFFRSLN